MRCVRQLCSWVVAVLVISIPSKAAAQDPAVAAAITVATRFLDAATANDWATVVRLTDDPSLFEYATKQRGRFRHWNENVQFRPTVEFYLQQDSTMPRVVAEYMVKQATRQVGTMQMPQLLMALADVERKEQVDSLSDEELYVRSLRASQIGYQTDLAVRRAGCASRGPTASNNARTVRGVAMLSKTEAVALYDESGGIPDGIGYRPLHHQLSMTLTKAGWRILPGDGLLSMSSGGVSAFWVSVDKCPPTTAPR